MSDRAKQLRQDRAKIVNDMRSIVDTADKEKRKLTDEESKRHSDMFDEQEKLKTQIVTEERQVELDRETASNELRTQDAERDQGKGKNLSKEERQLIGFRNFMRDGKEGLAKAESAEFRELQADTDTKGGYTVPKQWAKELIKSVDDLVFIRQNATVIPVTSGDSLGAMSLDADPEDGDWTGEITTVDNDTDMAFGGRELNPTLVSKLVKVSQRLQRVSALPIDQLVRQRLAYKFAVTQEKAFLTGSGANKPLGLFTASALGIPTSRDVSTDNTATAITADGLKNTEYALKAAYRRNAKWIFHRDGVKQVSKLKDGQGRYLWEDGLKENQPDTLLGRPVFESEFAPNTFTTGQYVGLLGDLSYYWIADSLALAVQVLFEKYADTNQIGYIGRMESDGMPVLGEAFARVKLG